jgi:DNA repair exonuclease SbcCD ATPase subunit
VIVRSLRAEGFMRYERIDIQDLPEGVIALVGDNESGKTTLGEAVAFALFGRTIRTEDTDPTQAINWEFDVCRTEIVVEVPEHGALRVERLVARTGEFEARLLGTSGEVLAEGPRLVNDALVGLIGFDFPTFRYSFYVAQGELDLVQRQGRDNAKRIVYDMLGITTIERAKNLLDEEASELRERSNTLERDLIVASALHTDALPLKEELAIMGEVHQRAQTELAETRHEVEQAETEGQRCEIGHVAQRERHTAFTRLERALVADTQRRNLLRTRQRLNALARQTQDLAKKAEGALNMEGQARQNADTAFSKAEKMDREARRLETLVRHRGTQLGSVLDEAAQDGLPTRKAREEQVVAREKRSMLLHTLLLAVGLLVFVCGTVGAVGMYVPAEKPFLQAQLPSGGVIQSPRLGLRADNLTPKKVAMASGTLGGLGLLLFVVGLVFRQKSSGRRQGADEEAVRLVELLSTDRGERAACEEFEVPVLKELGRRLTAISDPQVSAAFEALKTVAGDDMQRDETPAQILVAAKARRDELDSSAREAEPRLREAKRLGQGAKIALDRADEALQEAYPGGVPAAAGSTEVVPSDLAGLSDAIDEAAGQATRARIELDAALAGGADMAVAECVGELRAALTRGFAAAGEDGGLQRARYEEQTGLPELLKDREVLPTTDDLRAVVKRERELVDELLGDEGAAREAARAADEDLRSARQRRSRAQAGLDDAVARSERAEAGRKKLADLEHKMEQLRAVLDPTLRRVHTHEEAVDLLGDLVEVMRARFGPGIARYVEIVLPRLTGGRYTRVKIDADLDIRVYSRERGDYVRLIELSLGTADQLLVALRLGLARALAHSRGLPGGHFLFLDEPLVSADEGREQAFINLLTTFDDEFAQIFVSSPRELPADAPFSGYVRVSREDATLRYEAGTPA